MSYIKTYTGIKFHGEAHAETINIVDIAWALSNQCRYTGHTPFHYSVAQHSLYVADAVPQEYRLAALLHDASEAYLSDVARPWKSELPDYMKLEAKLQGAIYAKFGLKPDQYNKACIYHADMQVYTEEVYRFWPDSYTDFSGLVPDRLHIDITPMGQEVVFNAFLQYFVRLVRK